MKKVIFHMAVRDMLPEVVNQAALKVDRPIVAEEHRNVRLRKVAEVVATPDPDEDLYVLDTADPVAIESIWMDAEGYANVQLEAFDTDQIANEEAVAVEQLFAAGWEIDLD